MKKNGEAKKILEVYAYRLASAQARLFRRKKSLIVRWVVLLTILMPSLLMADDTSNYHQEIKIPLGLAWGDSVERLEGMARPGGFSIISREEKDDKTIMTVHGLLGVALKENLFVFQKNALVEIEYRYGDPSWNAQRYQDFFNSFRRMYDTKYGTGTQLIRLNTKKQNDITISLVGYQWSQSLAVLDLFYYVAEQPDEHVYRLISLHYKMP